MIRPLGVLLAAGGAALAVSVASVGAKEPSLPAGEKTFGRLDSDHDGKIGAKELAPKAQRRFMRLDKDGDGAVTAAEIDLWLKAMMDRRRDRIMARLDADKDGRITAAEVEARVGALVGGADTDKDGGVTLAEARAYYAQLRKDYFSRLRAQSSAN
jgi:Ca2+-binding EF-hand superfamily protein